MEYQVMLQTELYLKWLSVNMLQIEGQLQCVKKCNAETTYVHVQLCVVL